MTLPLSHNTAPGPTSRPPEDQSRAFSQLRTSLIKVLRNSPESREPICDALELIESLQQQVETKRHPDAPPTSSTRVARHADKSQDYLVQQTAEGDFLTERRPTGAQPFRCPRPTYDAAAQILADAKEPLHFEDLLDRLNAAQPERQADYRLRVCLRFWLSVNLITRFRTRYHPTTPATFLDDAHRAWDQLS